MLRRLVVRTSKFQNTQTNQQWPFLGKCKNLVVNKSVALVCCTAATIYRKFSNMATLETLKFDNLVLRSLPIDEEKENFRRQVAGSCFSKVKPTPVENPQLVAVSLPAMDLLDLPLSETERKDFVEYFSGNILLPGSETAAHCYCGHQFGYFSGQLGDGAAIYLGEIINRKGERWEIQLKGAGLTPYSRQADGRKVLRSTIREFLCSEAIHHLGIPTTRAGTCITSDNTVIRDMFYNGNVSHEKCTIVLRIAPTFLRFGSFEIFKPTDEDTGRKGPSVGRKDILNQMLQYTVKTFYPQIWESYSNDDKKMYVEFYKEVIRRTARLVADWQCVGWCHGVLNTDNMSIVGVTIDYGPYGFMDKYDPDFICNSSDDGGRYTYVKQPTICKWNCEKLAEAIQDIVPVTDTKPHLELFDEEYGKYYTAKMRRKFGLKKELPEDKDLVESFLDTMHKTGADFTNCFRCLSRLPYPGSSEFSIAKTEVIEYLMSQCSTVEELQRLYKPRMDPRQLQMFMMLMQTNPGLAPMLGRGFASFSQELERMEKASELKDLTQEQKSKENKDLWMKWMEKYEERLKKEDIVDVIEANLERVKIMNSVNPRFILRNYIAQNAIKAAESGDYSEVRKVLTLLQNPYSDDLDLEDQRTDPSVDIDTALYDEASGQDSSEAPASQVASNATIVKGCTGIAYDDKPPDWSLDLRVS